MAFVLCLLGNYGYRHTLKICNTYYVYTATIVTRTHLNGTFVRELPALFLLPDRSSCPQAQMLKHHMAVVCGLCDLTIVNSVTALRQAKSRFLQCPLSQFRISTTFFYLGLGNINIQVFQAGDKQATFRIPGL
jgi:hypothetical protein